jgi:hypothetical protein
MPELVFRLVYGSENQVSGSEAEIPAEIGRILASSRHNNDAAGITGALLFTGDCFTQVLEGPRHAVEETFERISRDVRHRGVMLVDLHDSPTRAFASWSMALLDTRGWAEAECHELARLVGQPADAQAGLAIIELLRRFLRQRMVLRQSA